MIYETARCESKVRVGYGVAPPKRLCGFNILIKDTSAGQMPDGTETSIWILDPNLV